jgi:hypothetical protein
MTVQRKRGRPSDYCAEIAMTICDRLAEGESLRAICADAGMPDKATVLRWIGRHKEFRDQYAWAREAQADDILEEILEIADDSSRDYVKKTGADGKVTWVVDREHIASCALRIKTRFRIAEQTRIVHARTERDFDAAFASLVEQRAAALFVASDVLFFSRRDRLVALAASYALPTIYDRRESAEAGGLFSYGTNFADAHRLVGNYVGRILKGEKAADLPVIQPTKFELVLRQEPVLAIAPVDASILPDFH